MMRQWWLDRKMNGGLFFLLLSVRVIVWVGLSGGGCLALSTITMTTKTNNNPCIGICHVSEKVCQGCFREEFEIQHWNTMTLEEQSMALEDAADRRQTHTTTTTTTIQPTTTSHNFHTTTTTTNTTTTTTTRNQFPTISTNPIHTCHDSDDDSTTTIGTVDLKKKKKKRDDDTVPPATPCTRICRYNANVYDGLVCIGCYRDEHDIRHWSSYDNMEKSQALEDAAHRCFLREEEEDSILIISKTELLRQANLWKKQPQLHNHHHHHHHHESTTTIQNNPISWNEIHIQSQHTQPFILQDHPSYDDFYMGNSILMATSPIITESERMDICQAARTTAHQHRVWRHANGRKDEGIIRIPTTTTTASVPTPVLDHTTNEWLQNVLFPRICQYLDQQHAPMIHSLFLDDQSSSLSQLYHSNQLAFASREPAINVYTHNGQFRPHTDGQTLTILIPLSSSSNYVGKGAAFWSPESRGHRIDPPSLTVKPNAGIPLLFVGHVTHSGMPVENINGERIVYVASFSLKRT